MSKKHNIFERWSKQDKSYRVKSGILIGAAVLLVPLPIIAGFLSVILKISFIAVWGNWLMYGLWFFVELGVLLYFLINYKMLGSRRVKKVNVDLEDSHFMSIREMRNNDGFTLTRFSELANVPDGFPIRAKRIRDDLDIILMNPIHALLIATTGTGKSTAYVSPVIEILSRTSTQPSFIITDPKGELSERHTNTLKKNGYNVHVVNLEMTYRSSLWNPFNDVWRKTARMTEEIKREKNKYRWGGRLYDTYADAEREKAEFKIRLSDEIKIDLQDLIYTACTVEAAQDKSWQQGARDLILGMVLRMWEDVRDGFMPKEKFNIYNLWWNLTQYARGDCEVLREYINECADEMSRAPGMANTVLVSEDRTLSSYLGSVNQYLHGMGDGGVAQLTSGNDLEFSAWDESPNALFIIVPEAKEGRYWLVALMLVQIYKALLEKAGVNNELKEVENKALKRPCYFIMDEFGLLPRIHRFEKIIPVARSHKMYFLPVLQNYTQLDSVYGQHDAASIKSNCPIKIFMGTDDPKTLDEFSNSCGKHKAKNISYNENNDMSVSTSAQSVPLIYPSELSKLNDPKGGVFGNAVITDVNHYPIKGCITPCFKAKDIFGLADEKPQEKPFMQFDEIANRYDIAKLLYLKHALGGVAEIEEAVTPEEKVDIATQQIAEATLREAAIEKLKQRVITEIDGLKGRISEADFIKLALANTYDKLKILDELADAATNNGDMFLVAQIEKIISFLKYDVAYVENEETIRAVGVNYNAQN